LAILALSAAPAAEADVGGQIISRCLRGQPLGGFSQSDYRKALKELSATSEEYSDCASLIHRAETAAATGRHGTTAGGGAGSAGPVTAIAATPTEQRSIAVAAKAPPAPISLGNGQLVHPGVVHADIGSAFSTLPEPLLAVLGLLLVGLLALGGVALRKRIRVGRPD
jgi:hypothetical protein